MKKLFTLVLSCFMLLSASSFAQKADAPKKKAKDAVTKVEKKEKKVTATTVTKADKKAKEVTASAVTKVDKKTKEVKESTTAAATEANKKVNDTKTSVATSVTNTRATTTKAVTEGVNKSADKAIGKDDKGRTIYLGSRGGQYTLSESGKKNYVKTANKLKVN